MRINRERKVDDYHNGSGFPVVRLVDGTHTPYNKRPGEVESRMDASLTYYDGKGGPGCAEGYNREPWLELRMEETTGGRSRVLSTTFRGSEEIELLRQLLTKGKVAPDNSRPVF